MNVLREVTGSPEKTPLHKVVSENLESWLEWRDRAERPVPYYVEEQLRGHLDCRSLCSGFTRTLATWQETAAHQSRSRHPARFHCSARGVAATSG